MTDNVHPYDNSPRTDGSVFRKSPCVRDLRFQQSCPEKLSLGTLGWRYPQWRGIVYDDFCAENMHWDSSLQAFAQFPLIKALRWLPSSSPQFLDSQWRTMRRVLPVSLQLWVRAPNSVCDPCIRNRFGKKRKDNPHFLNLSKALLEWLEPARQHFPNELKGVVLDILNDQTPNYMSKDFQRQEFYEKLRAFLLGLHQNKHLSTRIFVTVRNRKVYTPTLMKILHRTHCYPIISISGYMASFAAQLRAFEYYCSLSQGQESSTPVLFRWTHSLLLDLIRDRTIPHDPVTRSLLVHRMQKLLKQGHEVTCLIGNSAEGNAAQTLRHIAQLWLSISNSTEGKRY